MTQVQELADGFIPISVNTLHPDALVGVTLYIPDCEGKMQLYRGAHIGLTQADLQQLRERGLSRLFLRSTESTRYQEYLRENLDTHMADESMPAEHRFSILNEVVRDVLGSSFRGGKTDEIVTQCDELAKHSVNLICRQDVMASNLLSVMYHDYHTFTHSANVSYYCVMLAKALQLGDESDYHEIATGALLHDLGKLEISDKILCKPGRLTEQEFGTIKAHPKTGFQKLCQRDDLSYGQLMMVYQHHERLDGKGYPVGITEEEIHPWARVCSIVDVYEALTANRPYRNSMPTSEALAILDRDKGLAFDEEILKCWKMNINES